MSNSVNYALDLKSPENQILVEPNEIAEIKIIFTPSTVGKANHDCEIVFQNDKVNYLSVQLDKTNKRFSFKKTDRTFKI